ncbi:DMT family transporter [Paracoccus sp. MBLB3053]|uniref:DMT family transporter n=1 Tax=Paracoccus aurantius TaxID=3073814 RepID=A0ABU2HZV4_9RHOB|nr:DMT family transporter [Paracoccus sp. MBLB3053]MDS9470070.1 DMT family transporter [Paracoccus sp. MBLB3053]
MAPSRLASPSSAGAAPPRLIEIVAALATGSLLTLMLLSNSTMAAHTTPLFSSLTAHGVGTVVAGIVLAALWPMHRTGTGRSARSPGRAPLWAYLGGLSGALTVMLTSSAANSMLALTGTLAIGLAGQVVLALIFDCLGAMGLEKRLPRRKDLFALAAIVAGTILIIFARGMG